jgi:hypothetical protein
LERATQKVFQNNPLSVQVLKTGKVGIVVPAVGRTAAQLLLNQWHNGCSAGWLPLLNDQRDNDRCNEGSLIVDHQAFEAAAVDVEYE